MAEPGLTLIQRQQLHVGIRADDTGPAHGVATGSSADMHDQIIEQLALSSDCFFARNCAEADRLKRAQTPPGWPSKRTSASSLLSFHRGGCGPFIGKGMIPGAAPEPRLPGGSASTGRPSGA